MENGGARADSGTERMGGPMSVPRTMWRTGMPLALTFSVAVPVAAFAAVPGGPGAPAVVASSAADPAASPAVEGSPSSVQDRVAAFYGAYVDALTGRRDTALANALRSHYLTKEFRDRLASWERKNNADGIFRSQNTPRAWRVTYDNSGAGHAWTSVRLTWGDDKHPTYTYLTVQSDLSTKLISDIKEAPTPSPMPTGGAR